MDRSPYRGQLTAANDRAEVIASSSPTECFSVLVVDGQPLFREAITGRLRDMGAEPVHQAGTLDGARTTARRTGPCDLAILELDLPDGNGVELVTELRDQGWHHVVVLTASPDHPTVRLAFQTGADAYLLKSASPTSLCTELRLVLGGGKSVDPRLLPALAGNLIIGVDNLVTELSAREVEVLQMVADGLPNKMIGERLQLSALTVKSHLARIGRKIGTGDRARMVALALRSGIIR